MFCFRRCNGRSHVQLFLGVHVQASRALQRRGKGTFCFVFNTSSVSLVGNSGRLTWVRHSSRKSSATHSHHVCAVFLCVQAVVWLPVFAIWNASTHVDARGCNDTDTVKRVCTGSRLGEKNPLPHRGLEPESALRLAFAVRRCTS